MYIEMKFIYQSLLNFSSRLYRLIRVTSLDFLKKYTVICFRINNVKVSHLKTYY